MTRVIDGHEIGSLDDPEDEVVFNHPTARCTYGDGPDVTLTIGENVSVEMNMAEAVNLIESLRAAIYDYTERIEVFTKHYNNSH